MLLSLESVSCSYGNIRVLHDICLEVGAGEVVALIGANGAGKTTTLRAISGLVPVSGGCVKFDGEEITKKSPHQIVAAGIAHVPEGRQVFPELTVMDNLLLGGYVVRDKKAAATRIDEILERFPRLAERRGQAAGTLSGGEQQMLAIGRALVSRPRLLLLDELSMGLSPLLVAEVFDIVDEISMTGTTILLVEQNARMALWIADRAYVIQNGSIVMGGPAKEIAANEQVEKFYLGV